MTDIRRVDFNLLKALDALLEERNVTRAAARLGLTQPAVSGMLTRLRESFGDPLFIRGQHGIIPTPRALQLAGPLKNLLGEIDAMLKPVLFDPAKASMTVTMAATDYAQIAVVIPFLSALRQRAPGIKVAVRAIENDRIQRQFEQGELDLALLTPDMTPEALHARRLYEEEYVCALRTDHPDAVHGALPLDRFCALDHAIMSHSGSIFRGATDEALAKIGRTRRVQLTVPNFLVLLQILRTSDLVSVVPRRLTECANGLAIIEPPLEIPGFTKIAAWHERTHRDPGHRWVRSLLFETCAASEEKPAK